MLRTPQDRFADLTGFPWPSRWATTGPELGALLVAWIGGAPG